MIEVENLTKKYGSHVAVDNLSFRVERGMIYGFLGPNGAGKSTTMNMMTGYIAATSGTVKINGYDILKQTQIEDVKGRLIKNLSKGYKQRVGLAQAIIGYPEVIILDEPTVGLDPKQIIEIRELIRELAKKHTIILSSHILSEVSAVCDHIMILSKGKLVASDTPEGLMTLLKGGRQMKLSVLGEQSKVEELLRSMESVKDFSMQPPRAEGMVSVNIRTEDTEDIRVELFHRLAAADMPIMELSLSEKSLEDVFLELTGEEDKENEGNI